jgi:hypothetical protein
VFKIGAVALALVLVLCSVGKVSCQPTFLGQPGYSVETVYSSPAVLGDSMLVIVNVTNLAYFITASVDGVLLTFDWGATFSGPTPRIIEPGETGTWRFDPIDVPSDVWGGAHACLISVQVTFSYPTWPTERFLVHMPIQVQGEIPLQFPVQTRSQSGAPTMVTGPSLIKVVSVKVGPARVSQIYAVYRAIVIAVVALAIILLVTRPTLAKPIPDLEKSKPDNYS